MRLDAENFPIIWMREHDHSDDHDDDADRKLFLELLARGERFVLIAEKMPRPSDLAETTPEGRREHARMFKAYKGEMARLCAGMILIGQASGVALPIRKTIENVSSAMGIGILFADSEATAMELARERLEGGKPDNPAKQNRP
ncbi:hypothetical protein SAMN02982989_4418 [Xaviernesmea oryzae]|uniref:Uncharacterized protein n=1 Tax=Xaviernesmea oryzae TaxID=464029 RepID=A0A1X7GUD2_9HYPH|nr:hypothetical protein [Xaviernesmea oryzae]SMF74732.1 hypothetical protein SAMN02982989_4418 [Xaviernesmea oryzae]